MSEATLCPGCDYSVCCLTYAILTSMNPKYVSPTNSRQWLLQCFAGGNAMLCVLQFDASPCG